MVITDRLMAGIYPTFPAAMSTILKKDGLLGRKFIKKKIKCMSSPSLNYIGFYAGWWPALAQKIPSYSLTWMFFQQLKKTYESFANKKPSGEVSFLLGALAAAGGVVVMIPMDTVKTRLVIQVLLLLP